MAQSDRSRFMPAAKAAKHAANKAQREAMSGEKRQEFLNALPDEMPPVTEWDNPVLRQARYRRPDLTALRRARLKGAETGRSVVRSEIVDRDRSTCWICLRLVPEREIELDHVIPLSRGGKHDPENVRVACRECNRWKGARIITLR